MQQGKGLYETLLNIRKDVSPLVGRDGHNTFHNYKYATAHNVISEVRDLCNEHGLVVIPKGVRDPQIHSKGDGHVILGNFVYLLIAPNGEREEAIVYGAGEDKGDKSAYKGNTGSMKYLHLLLWFISTGDDPENDAREQQRAKAEGDKASAAKPLAELTQALADKMIAMLQANPANYRKVQQNLDKYAPPDATLLARIQTEMAIATNKAGKADVERKKGK